jgi:hypothetical protein
VTGRPTACVYEEGEAQPGAGAHPGQADLTADAGRIHVYFARRLRNARADAGSCEPAAALHRGEGNSPRSETLSGVIAKEAVR